jgi:cyclopropane-fatty-acyl-phospholipid synthase
LFAAAKFPKSRVTAVSNSRTQREYIEGQAKERGLTNLRVITCDVNHLTGDILGIRRSGEGGAAALVADAKVAAHTKPDAKKKPATDEPDSATGGGVSGGGGTETLVGGFDRVITIEMFEHMKNYDRLFGRVAEWVKPDTGRVFIHVFTNKTTPYHFEGDNWMARYFFAGGTMPSDDLFVYFQRDLQLLNQWCVNGKHYARTSRHWLNRMDANQPAIRKLFAETYGGPAEGKRWWVMWRVFFMAVEEMFAYNDGKEWLVSHYLFSRPSRPTATASATA